MGKDRVFTTGFSRMSERQYALWNTVKLVSVFFKIEFICETWMSFYVA